VGKIRVAFVKFAGLAAGGTERWLQLIAATLPRDEFDVDYFYCDAAPYIGSTYKHADTDPDRLRFMQEQHVNLVKFKVDAKDIRKPTHDWVGTDFWDKFDEARYDYVQTGKAGPAEYPYCLMSVPVVECVTLSAGVDPSPNIAWSFLLSQWQRRLWRHAGGSAERSSIVPVPVLPPAAGNDLRRELGIPKDAPVAGFHQRADDAIFSPWPLQAYSKARVEGSHFVVMGGSERYRRQAEQLHLPSVHFIEASGDATRISEFLNTLDVFAHGRRDGETFGTVLAEAMMHGRPCVSHPALVGNNNAQVETIGPGGYFARGLGQYEAMLQALLVDAPLRSKFSRKAKAHAEQYYSLVACMDLVIETYRTLAGVGPTPASRATAPAYEYSELGFLKTVDAGTTGSPHAAGYGADSSEELCVELFRKACKTNGNFVDIGAGDGTYSLIAAAQTRGEVRVTAYETDARRALLLRQSVGLNNWEDRLMVKSGEPGTPFAAGALKDDVESELRPHSGTAATATLDRQLEESGGEQVGLVRINAPGRELQILSGAEQIVSRQHPLLLLARTGGAATSVGSAQDGNSVDEWLAAHGYEAYACLEGGHFRRVGDVDRLLESASLWCMGQRGRATIKSELLGVARTFRGRIVARRFAKAWFQAVHATRRMGARAFRRLISTPPTFGGASGPGPNVQPARGAHQSPAGDRESKGFE
jgi:FkbM family methyltransferase